MTSLRAAVAAARDRLREAGIDDAQIEAELLLRYALEITGTPESVRPEPVEGRSLSRAQLYTRFEDELPTAAEASYESFLARRLAHEPSAYITARKTFCDLEFRVTHDVLIPRPETEGLVDVAVRELSAGPSASSGRTGSSSALCIVDVGTGSGAIAVSLAKALPAAELYATDVSRAALAVAAENARMHGVARRVALRAGYLLTPISCYVDCIVANLPYVMTGDWQALQPELRDHEPRLALDGGDNGLDLILALLRQAPHYLRRGGLIALEIGEEQAPPLSAYVKEALPDARCLVRQDFTGKDRYLLIRPAS